MAIKKTQSAATATRNKKKAASPDTTVSPQKVIVEAYYIYLRRMKNNSPGSDLSDWLEAEQMVRSSEQERRI